MPLLMIAQWFEGLRVRDPAAPAHIGERRRKLLLGRRIDVGTRRGADDERRNGGVARVVEDVREVEAAARERNPFDEVVRSEERRVGKECRGRVWQTNIKAIDSS